MLDEYELVSRADLERLKAAAISSSSSSDSLQQSVDKLTSKIDNLFELFERANEQIMSDVASSSTVQLEKKIAALVRQNEQLAKGLLSLHRLIESGKKDSYPLNISSNGQSNN